MRTIREFLDNKYAINELGEEGFNTAISDISRHIKTKHTASDGLDKSYMDNVGTVFRDGNALIIEGAMGATALGAAMIGGVATICGSEDTMLQSLAIGGVTTAGIMIIGYIKDRIKYNKSKARLKDWVQGEIVETGCDMPKMTDRTKDACLGEVCESLVDDLVMEMK